MAAIGIPYELGVSFVALTVSAFALTTLDTCTRLARYIVQEYFEGSPQSAARVLAKNRYVATTVPVFLSVLLLTTGEFGTLWPIFGSANQLLGALALLAVSVWLIKKNVNPVFTLVPMVFMFAVTLSSLFLFAWNYFNQHVYILAVVATFLFVLAIVLLRLAYRSLRVVDQQVTVQTS